MIEATDEVRREMAQNLRELEPWNGKDDIDVDDVRNVLGVVRGLMKSDVKKDWVEWLADIIDRPMCAITETEWIALGDGMSARYYACDNCGEYVSESDPSYCPHCGAKVVENAMKETE